MTNKELLQKIEAFVASVDDTIEDEWWCTNQTVAEEVMSWFKDFLKVAK